MKIVLGILIALFLLILLILLLPVGVSVLFEESGLILRAAAGPLRIKLYPPDEKPGKKKKKKKKEPKDEKKEKKRGHRPSLSDLLDAAKQILPGVFRMIGRFFRSIRIDPMDLSIVFAGLADPAGAALSCGRVQEAVWTLCPLLEKAVRMPDPHIHTEIDFLSEKTRVLGRIDVTARVGALLGAALCAVIPAFKWFLAWRCRIKKDEKARKKENDKKSRKKSAVDKTQAAA